MGRPARSTTPNINDDPTVDTEKLDQSMQALTEEGRRLGLVDGEWADNLPYDLNRTEAEFRFFIQQTSQSLIEAGRRMLLVKEHEPSGEFYAFLERNHMAPRSARKLMQAAVKYGNGPRRLLENLGRTKMLELMTEDDEDLDALAEGGTVAGLMLDDVQRMSVCELQSALRKARTQSKEAEAIHERMLSDKDSKINDLDARIHRRETLPETEAAQEAINEHVVTCVATISVNLARLPKLIHDVRDLYSGHEVPLDIQDQLDQAVVRAVRAAEDLQRGFPGLDDVQLADHSWIEQLKQPEDDPEGAHHSQPSEEP